MTGNIKIEKANRSDARLILEIQKTAFVSEAEIYNNYRISPLTQTLEELLEDFGSYVFLKALFNGSIVGSVKARLNENACFIGRLIVSPEYQGRGIGRQLMAEIERRFPGVEKYKLGTGKKSAKNIRFYQALGYTITGETEDNGVILVLMEKAARRV